MNAKSLIRLSVFYWERIGYLMRRISTLPSAILTTLLFVTGCAQTVQFRAIDAVTGEPLEGVSTSWRQDSHDLVFGSYHYGPTNLPPSSEDGVVVVRGIYTKKTSRFIFSREGYSTVYALYSRRALTKAEGLDPINRDTEFILSGDLTLVTSTNGLITVEMRPR